MGQVRRASVCIRRFGCLSDVPAQIIHDIGGAYGSPRLELNGKSLSAAGPGTLSIASWAGGPLAAGLTGDVGTGPAAMLPAAFGAKEGTGDDGAEDDMG